MRQKKYNWINECQLEKAGLKIINKRLQLTRTMAESFMKFIKIVLFWIYKFHDFWASCCSSFEGQNAAKPKEVSWEPLIQRSCEGTLGMNLPKV